MYWIVCTRPVGSFGTVCDTCTNGRDDPTFKMACRLFSAMMTGNESTRTSPRLCKALIATVKLTDPFPPVSWRMKSRSVDDDGWVPVAVVPFPDFGVLLTL